MMYTWMLWDDTPGNVNTKSGYTPRKKCILDADSLLPFKIYEHYLIISEQNNVHADCADVATDGFPSVSLNMAVHFIKNEANVSGAFILGPVSGVVLYGL